MLQDYRYISRESCEQFDLPPLIYYHLNVVAFHANPQLTISALSPTDLAQDPAKSGDLIAVHCGFRRFQSRAIYSQNNMHSDKHKHERFMGVGGHYVVSAYAPVMFGPAPVLVFRQPGRDRRALMGAPLGSDRSSARLTARSRQVLFNASCLLATGSLLTTDPDRIILKRVVLTGVPFKISKKTAVVCVSVWRSQPLVPAALRARVCRAMLERCRSLAHSFFLPSLRILQQPDVLLGGRYQLVQASPGDYEVRTHRAHSRVARDARENEVSVQRPAQAARHRHDEPLPAGLPALH